MSWLDVFGREVTMPQDVFPCTPAAFSVFVNRKDEGRLLSRSTPDAEAAITEYEAFDKIGLADVGFHHTIGFPPKFPID
jgi:hypothetical protein